MATPTHPHNGHVNVVLGVEELVEKLMSGILELRKQTREKLTNLVRSWSCALTASSGSKDDSSTVQGTNFPSHTKEQLTKHGIRTPGFRNP